MAITLKNKYGEYVQKVDTANEKLYLTKDETQAQSYSGRPGGGEWDANNEKEFLIHYFEDEFKDRVTSLTVAWVDNNN